MWTHQCARKKYTRTTHVLSFGNTISVVFIISNHVICITASLLQGINKYGYPMVLVLYFEEVSMWHIVSCLQILGGSMKKRQYEMREEKFVLIVLINYISKCCVESIRINRSEIWWRRKNEETTEQLSTNRSVLGWRRRIYLILFRNI